jgi:NAD(P)-dependent dehydrogenase (short-subunit alcohol dehydrogenase family)
MRTPQHPIPSHLAPSITAGEVAARTDLRGKVAIVTGGYSGLGLETTRVLAEAGAIVVVPARSPEKARRALASIARVERAELDLLEPQSIDAFAAGFLASGRPLHMLVNGAGIMATPLVRDARGYESQFAANHLGHYQLAARLWPALRRAGGARVISVSSRAHWIAGMDFGDPHFDSRPYERWQAYAQSKTANVLFAVALDACGQAHGVRAFALHPGTVLTDLARHLSDEDLDTFGVSRDTPHGQVPEGMGIGDGGDYKTIEQGAATTVWCATSDQLQGMGGVYCENVDIASPASPEQASGTGVKPWAIEPELAERLWSLSERLTGVAFEV